MMKLPSKGQKPGMAGREAMGPDMMAEGDEEMPGDQTILPVGSYPELEGAEEGQKVTLMGTVVSNDGENVTIGYDSVKLQTNLADKALGRLTGKKTAPVKMAEEDEGDGY